MTKKIQIVFDGPPDAETGRFVEVEDENGASISVGEWVHRDDGYWALVLEMPDSLPASDDSNSAAHALIADISDDLIPGQSDTDLILAAPELHIQWIGDGQGLREWVDTQLQKARAEVAGNNPSDHALSCASTQWSPDGPEGESGLPCDCYLSRAGVAS